MPGDTSALLVSRLSKGPDLSVMEPMDLGGLAGAFLGGQEAGRGLKQRRQAGEDLSAGDYAGGLARGLLRGRAIQQETQDPAGAIKMKLLQQKEQMGNIELQEAMWRRDDAVTGRAAAASFLPVITNYIRSGQATDPKVQQEVLNWLASNPEAFDDPRVKRQYELFNRSKTILQAEEAARRALAQPGATEDVQIGPDGGVTRKIGVNESANWQPSTGTLPNPSGGDPIPFMKTSPRSAQPMMEPRLEELTDPVTGERRSVLRSGMSGARPMPSDIGKRQQEAFQRTQQAEQLKFIRDNQPQVYADLFSKSPIDPDTGMPKPTPEAIQQAAKVAGFEPGTKAKMEEQMVAAEDLFTTAQEFLPLITKSNVGWRGAARRWGSRLGMDDGFFKNATDAQAAATMSRVFMASIFRTLRSDSNIAKPEVEALEAAAPDTTRFIDDPDSIKSQMAALLRNANNKDRNAAQRMGKPVSNFFLTREEIIARGQAGELTTEQAAALLNKSAWKLIEALEAE